MNILEIIVKKRDKQELTKEEIEYFVEKYTSGEIGDYHAAALLMAIYFNGMTHEETANLTMAMVKSGDIMDLSPIGSTIVDKHSTGGIGDKVSMVLLPIMASLGVKVAKLSGRGLGYTGGTADKLEAIPGYNVQLSEQQFIESVKKVGISMIAQTDGLAPADKKIYSLRSSIACIESIPLIASSIMSKKIASGADKVVLEVTVGSGAFMKNEEDATKLANEMIRIGKLVNKKVVCVLTRMDEPLGHAIGNNIEIVETVECLKGNMADDVKEVVLEVGSYILMLSGIEANLEKCKELIMKNIENGKAYNKFIEMVENQGGDTSYIKDTDKFGKAKYIKSIYAESDGYINEIDAGEIGVLSCYLGTGRIRKDDLIDYSAGIILNKKVGQQVYKGEEIAKICSNSPDKIQFVKSEIEKVIKINIVPKIKEPVILKVIE